MAVRQMPLWAAAAWLAFATPLVAQNAWTLRVIDSATLQPIERAEVLVAGYAIVRTSELGTVSLSFIKNGAGRLVVRRVGYEASSLDLTGGARSGTVTVPLRPLATTLPTVTTEAARYRKLEMMGFYERRKSSAAPRSAFITQEDLERWKPTLLSDVRYKTGRSIGSCATYLDGVRLGDSGSRGNTYRRGIDGLVQPSEVAAMEVYRMGEAPAQYTPPRATCVVLIWLK